MSLSDELTEAFGLGTPIHDVDVPELEQVWTVAHIEVAALGGTTNSSRGGDLARVACRPSHAGAGRGAR